MSGPAPFGPDELDGVAGLRPDELAAETRLARDLEGIAARDTIAPPAGFADRVMAAVAREPVPAPAIAARSALRHAAPAGLLVSLRDAFRVSFSGGFPVAVRAQAFALVLLVVGITAGSGYAAAGALGLLGERPSPSPSIETPSLPQVTTGPTDTPAATFEVPSPSPSPSATPEATGSAEPSESPEATEEPDEAGEEPEARQRTTPEPTEPTERPEATNDHGGDDDESEGGDDDESGSGEGGDEGTGDPGESPHSDDD